MMEVTESARAPHPGPAHRLTSNSDVSTTALKGQRCATSPHSGSCLRWISMSLLPVLVVHGGAGYVPRKHADLSCKGVSEAARAGYVCLRDGLSAMDAVVKAVTLLEDNPVFNAGRGSVLTHKGTVEMDAIVMDGCTLSSGAVSAVKRIANPVQLARLVMEKTSHLCLTAEGASQFARDMGIPEVDEESLITDYSRMRWRQNLSPDANPVESQILAGYNKYLSTFVCVSFRGKMGTVGAVAVDLQGNIACATSTGGLINQMEGRVGDTACIGDHFTPLCCINTHFLFPRSLAGHLP
ncbi:isoaspartyl peptidase/L-asparaginase-like [Arapaima gigas]